MSAPLVFVIPIRHQDSVARWDVISSNLRMTLASIAAQTSPEWECVVVANTGADLPDLPAGCSARFVDLPLPKMPDRENELEAFYDVVRHDKGLRLWEGVKDIAPDSHVMVVDFDDFVSRRLAATVVNNRHATGWTLTTGFVWAGGSWIHKRRDFHRLCGTSHIVRRDAYGELQRPDGSPEIEAVKRKLGSHIFIDDDFARAGTPLTPLGFPGAVYRIGNTFSTSGTGGLFGTTTPPRQFLRHPKGTLRNLSGYRRVSDELRREFSLPA